MLCLNYAFLSFDLQPYQVDSKVSLISEVNSNRPIPRKKIVALRAVTMREACQKNTRPQKLRKKTARKKLFEGAC